MNMHVRQWRMWEDSMWEDDETADQVIRGFLGSLVGGVGGVFTGSILDTLLLPSGISVIICIFIILITAMVASQTHRIGILGAVGDKWNNSEARRETRYYLEMSSEEKAEYPRNILSIMRDRDVTDEQKRVLAQDMRKLRNKIEQRRAAIAAARPVRKVDIDGALAVLRDNAHGIDQEISVYRELS